jgi:hypothetical protein
VNKNAGFAEIISIIVLYFLALGATIFFTIFIQVTLSNKNVAFETGNDVLTFMYEHTYEN